MSQALIITGMHRSGTSMISSLLQAAGVHLGDHLLAGNSANPRGYFEDLEIYAFHERLLNARNQTYLYLDSNFSFQPTQEECDEARRLAMQRSHVPLWGWKDPRTAPLSGVLASAVAGRSVCLYLSPPVAGAAVAVAASRV